MPVKPQEPFMPIETPEVAALPPEEVHATPVFTPPTLDTAFYELAQALSAYFEDDLGRHVHAEEIQAWYANAGGDMRHSNCVMAWRHAILLLEGVLGTPLTQR